MRICPMRSKLEVTTFPDFPRLKTDAQNGTVVHVAEGETTYKVGDVEHGWAICGKKSGDDGCFHVYTESVVLVNS